MLARLSSASLRGLDAEAVDVEVDLSRGLPCWSLVDHINTHLISKRLDDCFRPTPDGQKELVVLSIESDSIDFLLKSVSGWIS